MGSFSLRSNVIGRSIYISHGTCKNVGLAVVGNNRFPEVEDEKGSTAEARCPPTVAPRTNIYSRALIVAQVLLRWKQV